MKRKPILFNRLTALQHGMGREVIGLIGTHRGAGVTYTGLMLAFYMGEELGKKTAYLECNAHQDMVLLQNAYEWSKEDAQSFSFHRITCYKEVSSERITGILNEDYECIILDFGVEFLQNREEFLRCSKKITVSGRARWNLQKLKAFTNEVQDIPGSVSWYYFITQAPENSITKIQHEIMRRVWAVPVNEEPTMPSREINRFFGKIF